MDVSKFEFLEECIDYILHLDDNFKKYLKIVNEPINRLETEINYEQKSLIFLIIYFRILDIEEIVSWQCGRSIRTGYKNKNTSSSQKIKRRLKID